MMPLSKIATPTLVAAILASTVGCAGTDPVESAAANPSTDLAAFCTTENLGEIARASTAGVTVAKVANGPGLPGGVNFVPASGKVPAYCQVTGSYVTNPATGKTANFIATFPQNWNGKYLQLGCSGSCGVLLMNNPAMPAITITAQGYPGQLIEKGYATFGNDLGHSVMGPGITWDWAFRADGSISEDNLADFLYRADEVLAETGKSLTRAFYSRLTAHARTIDRSYYSGCSQGGRGALIAASRFPEKFDGIIAGSPASDLPGLIFHPAGRSLFEAQTAVAKLSQPQIELLHSRVTSHCDALDGVSDGLIQNPAACNFVPERDLPLCKPGASGDACFTVDQARMVNLFTSGVTDTHGHTVAPGHSVSEISLAFDLRVPAGQAHDSTIRKFVGAPPAGEPLAAYRTDLPGSRVVANGEAYRKVAEILRRGVVYPEDISRLVKSGGKLLWYHNLSDEALTPYLSINRYKQLARLQGGYDRLQRNVRLFSLPGTGHCGMSGVGPTNFDAIGALEAWVERGAAPNALVARKLNPQTENLLAGKVDWSQPSPRTMPLCMFPQMASYKGMGDINVAANWECRANDKRMLQVEESGRLAGAVE